MFSLHREFDDGDLAGCIYFIAAFESPRIVSFVMQWFVSKIEWTADGEQLLSGVVIQGVRLGECRAAVL